MRPVAQLIEGGSKAEPEAAYSKLVEREVAETVECGGFDPGNKVCDPPYWRTRRHWLSSSGADGVADGQIVRPDSTGPVADVRAKALQG